MDCFEYVRDYLETLGLRLIVVLDLYELLTMRSRSVNIGVDRVLIMFGLMLFLEGIDGSELLKKYYRDRANARSKRGFAPFTPTG